MIYDLRYTMFDFVFKAKGPEGSGLGTAPNKRQKAKVKSKTLKRGGVVPAPLPKASLRGKRRRCELTEAINKWQLIVSTQKPSPERALSHSRGQSEPGERSPGYRVKRKSLRACQF
jgi:hypothetical protein